MINQQKKWQSLRAVIFSINQRFYEEKRDIILNRYATFFGINDTNS